MLNDILRKADLHITRAQDAKDEILGWDYFDQRVFQNKEKIKTIDSFIFRFIKLQDLFGQKLFKATLVETGDYQDDMSYLDILDKLEKLRIIDSAKTWMNYRNLRNELTHEYPDNETEIVEGIKMAVTAFANMIEIMTLLKKEEIVA